MASNLLFIVLLVLVSLSVTCAYSLPTRDDVLKREDESYFMATIDQVSSTTLNVEDLAKTRSLRALFDGSKVVVNKASSRGSGSFKLKSKKIGSLDVLALVGIIIAAVIVTLVIIYLLISLYLRFRPEMAQNIGQDDDTKKVIGSSETQISKAEDRV